MCVNLSRTRKLSQTMATLRSIYTIVTGNQSALLPSSTINDDRYSYLDPLSDEALLSEVSPLLVQMKEVSMVQVNIESHDNEIFPGRRSFVSKKRHAQLTADSLAELWGIRPKWARATLLATTQRVI